MPRVYLTALLVLLTSSSLVMPQPAAAYDFAFITTTDYSSGSSSAIWLDGSYTTDENVASIYSDAVSRYFEGLIYVVNREGADNIQVLDPGSGFSTLRQFSVGNGSDPHDIALASETKAYVTRYNTNDLWIVDPSTGSHTGTIDLSSLADSDGLCEMDMMLLVGDRLFVSIERLDRDNWWGPSGTSYIAVVDTEADTLLDTDPMTAGKQSILLSGTNPYGDIQFNPYDGKLYVSCIGWWGMTDGGVERIDPVTFEILGTMITEAAAGGDINDVTVASAAKGYAIVTDSDFFTLLISFDPSAGTATGTLYEPGDYVLYDIELSPSKELFLCDRTPTLPGIRIYDTYSDTEITSGPIDVGLPPFDICFSMPIQTDGDLPLFASMGQNYPNPFNPATTIPFSIKSEAEVKLTVYDVSGRLVRRLIDKRLPAGSYEAAWNGRDGGGRGMASGVYFAKLRAGSFCSVKKMVLMR